MIALPIWLVVCAPMFAVWFMVIAYGVGHFKGYTKGERSSGQDYRQGYQDALVALENEERTDE